MNRKLPLGILAIVLAATLSAVGHEAPRGRNQANSAMQEVELRRLQMDMEARESELDFQRQLQQLELDERRNAMERSANGKHGEKGGAPVVLLFLAVVHVLLTIWVYQDIQKRKTGSGVWIAIALLTGVLGTAVYALVRLGDMHQESS
jgi:hypothetical protein